MTVVSSLDIDSSRRASILVGRHERAAYFLLGVMAFGVLALNDIARLDPLFPIRNTAGIYQWPAALLAASFAFRKFLPRLGAALAGFGLIGGVGAATYIMSFQVHALGAPLADPLLLAADRAIGVNWDGVVAGISANGLIFNIFGLAYHSVPVQMAFVVLFTAWRLPSEYLYRFCALIGLASLIGLVLAAILPGISMLQWADRHAHPNFSFAAATPAHLVYAMRLRDTSAVDLSQMKAGMLTFPSFHALFACLLAYGMLRTPLAKAGIVLNSIMMVSAIGFGAHYVVDLVGGVLTFLGAIALLDPFCRLLVNDTDRIQEPCAMIDTDSTAR